MRVAGGIVHAASIGVRVGAGVVVADSAPALTAVAPLRRRVVPRLSGRSERPQVALTFDDGPDPESTPAFLDLLSRHGRQATFFVLGAHVREHPGLLRRVVDAGHEVGVHGWTHRCTVAVPPRRLQEDLRRTREMVEDLGGAAVVRYRPPYGVLTVSVLAACRKLGLEPVLWTAWGRDWEESASAVRIASTVLRTLEPGGTVLLHDTSRHAPHGDWARTLAATDMLLSGRLRERDLGPLAEHW